MQATNGSCATATSATVDVGHDVTLVGDNFGAPQTFGCDSTCGQTGLVGAVYAVTSTSAGTLTATTSVSAGANRVAVALDSLDACSDQGSSQTNCAASNSVTVSSQSTTWVYVIGLNLDASSCFGASSGATSAFAVTLHLQP